MTRGAARVALAACLALAAARAARAQDSAKPAQDPKSETTAGSKATTPESPATVANTAPAKTAPAVPAEPPVLDYARRFDLGSFEAALGGIAAAYPDLLRVRSLGKSRGGKDVWLAVVADTSGGDPARLPAALVTTSFTPSPASIPAPNSASTAVAGGAAVPPVAGKDAEPLLLAPRIAGPEAALYALSSLLQRARAEPDLKARLRRAAIYFLPAPDPDEAFPSIAVENDPGPRQARLDRNFPAGWDPFDAEARPAGPYPLCEPETRLLAHFLVDRTNLSVVVVLSNANESTVAAIPKGDPAGDPVPAAAASGSLEAFCRDVLDAGVVRTVAWRGAPRASAVGNAPDGFQTAATLVHDLLDDLPRLECSAPKVERLRPDLWVVDLDVANAGSLSSSGRSARGLEAGSVRLKTSGGRVVACAARRGEKGSFDALRPARNAWSLGDLAGNERISVRIVVQAEEAAAVEAVFEGPRGGRVRVEIPLR